MPFSDPLADGPVIHAAGTAALRAGATRPRRARGRRGAIAERVPVIVMCYANPILARGLERFADALVAAGASGLIVPDLPLEEAAQVLEACDARGLALVPLVAPTTPDERLARIGAGRPRVPLHGLGDRHDRRARRRSTARWRTWSRAPRRTPSVPVAVGFGIGTPEQAAAAAAAGADGVIVGSRLVRAAGEAVGSGRARSRELVRELLQALSPGARLGSRADGPDPHRHRGLCLWIVLWALNVRGFDAILIAIVMVLVAIGVRNLLPFLPGRRD